MEVKAGKKAGGNARYPPGKSEGGLDEPESIGCAGSGGVRRQWAVDGGWQEKRRRKEGRRQISLAEAIRMQIAFDDINFGQSSLHFGQVLEETLRID